MSLEAVAKALGMTKRAVLETERSALAKMRDGLSRLGIDAATVEAAFNPAARQPASPVASLLRAAFEREADESLPELWLD